MHLLYREGDQQVPPRRPKKARGYVSNRHKTCLDKPILVMSYQLAVCPTPQQPLSPQVFVGRHGASKSRAPLFSNPIARPVSCPPRGSQATPGGACSPAGAAHWLGSRRAFPVRTMHARSVPRGLLHCLQTLLQPQHTTVVRTYLHQSVDLLEQVVEEGIPLCLKLWLFWMRRWHFG